MVLFGAVDTLELVGRGRDCDLVDLAHVVRLLRDSALTSAKRSWVLGRDGASFGNSLRSSCCAMVNSALVGTKFAIVKKKPPGSEECHGRIQKPSDFNQRYRYQRQRSPVQLRTQEPQYAIPALCPSVVKTRR